jgi:hypothetical protein
VSLEFFRDDVYHLNLGSGNEQIFGASEECLGHFPIDVGASSLFVVEGIEDAKRRVPARSSRLSQPPISAKTGDRMWWSSVGSSHKSSSGSVWREGWSK